MHLYHICRFSTQGASSKLNIRTCFVAGDDGRDGDDGDPGDPGDPGDDGDPGTDGDPGERQLPRMKTRYFNVLAARILINRIFIHCEL